VHIINAHCYKLIPIFNELARLERTPPALLRFPEIMSIDETRLYVDTQKIPDLPPYLRSETRKYTVIGRVVWLAMEYSPY